MNIINKSKFFLNRHGMTIIEMLIVVSLVSMISLALYHSLINGLKVWEESRRLIIEEDVAIFLDKLSQDLRNVSQYSKITIEGNEYRFSFPTIVRTQADAYSGLPKDAYVDQLGKVEYYYDILKDSIFRRQANYSQAMNERFQPSQLLAKSIERFNFRYYYLTRDGKMTSVDVLDVCPSGVEVEVEFFDKQGLRVMRKYIDIPVDS